MPLQSDIHKYRIYNASQLCKVAVTKLNSLLTKIKGAYHSKSSGLSEKVYYDISL